MKYGKIIDGRLAEFGGTLIIEDGNQGRVIFNPTEDMLLNAGYFPVRETAPDTPVGYQSEPYYIQGEDCIYQQWRHVPLPEPEPEPIDEITLLKAQIKALSERNDFMEDCIAEMAEVVYA